MKRYLEEPIRTAYIKIDETLVRIKSSLISLCAEIDRYFYIGIGINVREEVSEDTLNYFLRVYPLFRGIKAEQLKRLLSLFLAIRNENAHLYLNKAIFIDEDLKDILFSICEPKYRICGSNRELTIYGSFYILMLLSQKYMIWPVTTSFLRSELFYDIPTSKDKMSIIQQDSQKYYQCHCGIRKPISFTTKGMDIMRTQNLSETIKRTLTELFFDLEKILLNRNIAFEKEAPSFGSFLKSDKHLSDEGIVKELTKLRNVWLHGYNLNDEVYEDGTFTRITIETVLNPMIALKETLPQKDKYLCIHDNLNSVATSIFHFYALRVVEVGHKLLDSTLLSEDKIDERINNLKGAVLNIKECPDYIYEKLGTLLIDNKIHWKIGASKYTDKRPRNEITTTLEIYSFHSDEGFTIGNYHTSKTDLVIPKLAGFIHPENKVNGKYIAEYEVGKVDYYSNYFKFITVK